MKKKILSRIAAAFVLCALLSLFTACPSKSVKYDVAVIGSGGAGLSAALAAKNAGASVIVIEKMSFAGGNTNYATGGLNASETSVQKAKNIADTTKQFYEDTMKGGKNLNNQSLVRILTSKSAEAVDWLIAQGMDLSDVGKSGGATNSRTHRPTGGAAIGSHFIEVMLRAVEKAGVDIRYNTRVTGIISKSGKVAGITVSGNDKTYDINAKAVVIASGGFGANSELLVSYKPNLAGFGTTNHPGASGDAFEWVKPFNAALTDMDQIQTHPTVVPTKNIMITEAVRGNGAIMINREAERFEQEMTTRDVMSAAILKQTGETAFLVFDQGVRNSLKAIESYYKKGLLTEGASLAELADKLKIPADKFEASVKRYNSFVAAKNDSDFKRADLPRKLESAPFYGVEVGPAVHHTMGGISINENAQVLDKEGKAIDGLFAAGEVTGGVHGANRLGGNAMTDITVFGKIAGTNAAAFAKR